MGDFETKISERVAALETEMQNVKDDVKVLGSIEKAITKLATLMEVQATTIGEIHNEIKDTKNDVSELKEKVNSHQIEEIKKDVSELKDKFNAEQEASTIKIPVLIKRGIIVALAVGIIEFIINAKSILGLININI